MRAHVKRRLMLLGLAALGLQACAHSVHQVYVSSMDRASSYAAGKWVSVEKKDFVVLGFEMDTRYVQDAYHALEEQCPGRLSQVTSEHLTSYFFLSYDQKLVLQGLCTQK